MRIQLVLMIGVSLFCTARFAVACNIPVFRYALERWKSDPVEIFVFHDQPLSDVQQQQIDQFRKAPQVAANVSNAELQLHDVDGKLPDDVSLFWKQLADQQARLPLVAVRTRIAGQQRSHWHRPLDQTHFSDLLWSPRREAVADRLLSGHAIVWLMLDGPDAAANDRFASRLTEQLDQLAEEISLPEGVGLPGSELFADVPLLMQFSVLRLSREEAAERYLIDLMDSSASSEAEGPILMPVFGRGRAFSVIAAEDLTPALVEDIVVFLCGACSCQVKEQNPGFDLLMSTNWDQQLFGDFATALPPLELTRAPLEKEAAAAVPEMVKIPTGETSIAAAAVVNDEAGSARKALLRQGTLISLMIVLMAGIVIALCVARRVDF